MNQLEITALSTKTYIGVYPWEQQILQELSFDITIPLTETIINDDLANTIDYEKLCQHITSFVESNRFRLIETVATQVVKSIQEKFNVPHITLRVSKPHAIINAGNISILITR